MDWCSSDCIKLVGKFTIFLLNVAYGHYIQLAATGGGILLSNIKLEHDVSHFG